ncbi:Vps51/Vps67-domain-containing protein [Aspergillus bertholletiae]|uniref:Conserved oligomeric Golgi complex subunit 1 n=1 Tax=Aspergillus bertholletiae TaxID=1226010 RepID=A0A5N7ASJ3_9EURO|nr:Vps51/Vps67-domain-containing protein [Aspergillus bertholletiae]
MASDGPDPQSLNSWQDAFQYPIPTVRRVEQELRRDIASNKEKLRALVGTRYRELVGTAETIVSMNREMQEVDATLADIGRRCNPRLMEKKVTHFSQIKGDIHDKGATKRAVGAQLALLHRCETAISRLLRRRDSLLLGAKLVVVSRLLHKALAQQKTVPPFLESLRNQIASLRQTLLRRVNKCLASASSTADDIIEALASYCLATSSSSEDAIRHFHRVREEVIESLLGIADSSGENILKALGLYVSTLQISKVLLSRRLSDVLGKLKARPILTDPEIHNLDDLNLDVFGRWVPPDVSNFTPWIKLSELSKSEVEKTLKKWSKQAFEKFVQGCQKNLESWLDFSMLLSLRQKALEFWLRSWASTITHSPLQVLEGIRGIFNNRLMDILSDQARSLANFGQDVTSKISTWDNADHAMSQSLWDHELMVSDYSNGADIFKSAIADRMLGCDEEVSHMLREYRSWLASIEKSKEFINELRQIRWNDIIEEGEDEDFDLDTTATLTEDDPRLLQDALRSAVREAFSALQSSFSDAFQAFGGSNHSGKAAFILKLIRLIRRDLPNHLAADDFAFSKDIVPQLQEMLATEVVTHTSPSKLLAKSGSQVPGRSLWEGDPELPIQPSSSTFKLLRRLVGSMDRCGPGLWDVATVQVLKRTLQGELSNTITSSIEILGSCDADSNKGNTETGGGEAPNEQEDPASNDNEHAKGEDAREARNAHDLKLQLYFDTAYLSNALAVKGSGQNLLMGVLEKLRGDLGSADNASGTMEHNAAEHWKRTQLLFGLLAIGGEQ